MGGRIQSMTGEICAFRVKSQIEVASRSNVETQSRAGLSSRFARDCTRDDLRR